jgi:hypothetical protein
LALAEVKLPSLPAFLLGESSFKFIFSKKYNFSFPLIEPNLKKNLNSLSRSSFAGICWIGLFI